VSDDAGSSFTGTSTDPRQLATVNQDSGQATTDQWWQWESYTQQGALAVSYYDRQYGNDESIGYSDFSLLGVERPALVRHIQGHQLVHAASDAVLRGVHR